MRAHGLRGGPPERECEDDPLLGRDRIGNWDNRPTNLEIKSNKYSKKMWRQTELLVVDEVSMLSLKLFDTLNQIGKAVRGNNRPFGGIQVIFSGDFYQLPPVGNKEDKNTMRFCFESDDWNSIFHRDCQIQLLKIFRQKDKSYASLLNQVREGKIKRKTIELLQSRVVTIPADDPNTSAIEGCTGVSSADDKNTSAIEGCTGVSSADDKNTSAIEGCTGVSPVKTKLFPTKNRVEVINSSEMNELNGEEREYVVKFKTDPDKKGVYTDNEIKFELEYLSNNLICERTMKLKVGAHVMCVANMQHEKGERGLEICNGSQGIIMRYCQVTGCPVVKYNSGIEMVMTRHLWSSEKIQGIGVLQVPLILAWALTIHKSQGSTLDAAEIDVGSGIFECGQTYVALSRVKSLEGLFLSSFDVTKIRINKKVKDYYEALTLYQDKAAEIFVPVINV